MTASTRSPASGLCLVGVNRRGAGTALCERLFAEAFDPGGLLARLAIGAAAGGLAEAMALATGERLEVAALANDPDGFAEAFAAALADPGPHLIHVRIRPGSLASLGRPTLSPREVADRFKAFLAKPLR